jgi:hypothetical protein
MLPRLPAVDDGAPPPSWMRRASNFDKELAPWFRMAAMRAIAAEIDVRREASSTQNESPWPEEPPSARIPFLIF